MSKTATEYGVIETTVHLNSPLNDSGIKNTPLVQEKDPETSTDKDSKKILFKRKLKESNNLDSEYRKKIKIMQQQKQKYKKKLENVKMLFDALKKERFIENDSLDLLRNTAGPKFIELIKRQDSKSGEETLPNTYSPELRTFALTLHYYSPRAYEYVRETFDTCLPHSRTISKWHQKVNGAPGFTSESLNALAELVKNNHNLLFSLTFDEIAIKKNLEFDGHTTHGYIDMGTENDDDSAPLAREAIVLMVVAINGNFKVPVGYFLTYCISAREKANLISQCLSQLHSIKVEVVSVTFNGLNANLHTATHLGCDFSLYNLKTSFKHPDTGQDIVVFLDPAHMLKLVRDTLGCRGSMVDSDNNIIDWKFVKKLNSLQEDEGLNLGNKLSPTHILYNKQKMKVRLGTQTLSTSVADAIKLCSQVLCIESFQESEATVKFLNIFNDLFDILNSHSKEQAGCKKPISEDNFDAVKYRLTEIQNYICTLKTGKNNCKMVESNMKTGFVGFLICIESLRKLYNSLVKTTKKLKYIPMYKLSQNPMELFFQYVRSQAGCDDGDDPTARQFKVAFKKLIINSEIKHSNKSNALLLQSINILTVSSKTDPQDVINSTTERNQLIENLPDTTNSSTLDHDYILDPGSVSKFSEHIIYYVAGFVVRKLSNDIKCDVCIEALFSMEPHSILSLVPYTSRGDLIIPSNDVYHICKNAESEFRRNTALNRQFIYEKNAMLQTEVKTLRLLLNKSLFTCLESHSFDQEPLENHAIHLMRAIIKQYLNIRFRYYRKYIVRRDDSLRQFYNEMRHFKF